jgi:hypothetical protein
MSGNWANRFKEMYYTSGFSESRWRCGTIFSLGHDHNVPSLCDATRLVPEGGFKFAESLPEDSSVIEIDRRTYFPLRIEQTKLNLKRAEAAPYREFFNSYRKTNLFCVHRDCHEQKGGSSRYLRHHAIDLDVNCILPCEPFATRFNESLQKIDPAPKLIITPPHQAGIAMAENARQLLASKGHTIDVLVHPDLKFADGDLWSRRFRDIRENENILIIDDVSVTGSRLARFAQSLRALQFEGQIHFRVGIARPQSAKHWRKVCGQLRSRGTRSKHTVEAIHEVVLPNWHRKQCPWCTEQRFYTDALSALQVFDKALSKRLSCLSTDEFSNPWTDGIFFTDSTCPFPPLAPEAIFIDEGATQAALFAAVCSLIQRMRVGEALPEMRPSNYPEVSVIDTDNYLGGRFPEASIRAAIMRALMINELQAPRNEDEIGRADAATSAIFEDELSRPLILEIMLQSKLGKLPPLALSTEQAASLKSRYGAAAELLLSK